MENRSGQVATKRTDSTQADEALRRARIIDRFPAGHPRGSKPAEEFAAAQTAAGTPATVVMDLTTDTFLVKAVA
jgi:hypothetical protein